MPDSSIPAVSRTRLVRASPRTVFDILADPRQHPVIDGETTVKAQVKGPSRLYPDARFRMRMRIGVPYLITNTVVEWDEGRRIGWRHLAGYVWRYELRPLEQDGRVVTEVTETFDPAGGRLPDAYLRLTHAAERNAVAITRTLERLARVAEARERATAS